jgi:hydroxymethylbilane synthase
MAPLRLGTRGSQLARWQADAVAAGLGALGHRAELVVIKTTGDRLQDAPLSEAGGKRLFVKDLEDALLRREIDLAVHSAKDLPADTPGGLTIGAALAREDPRDALVLPPGHTAHDLDSALAVLSDGTRRTVGTGSVRRISQLAPQMPHAVFAPIRGNVDTRLRKLDAGEFDALVLACAGLRRLNLEGRISAALPVDRCIPAPGQGIIVVETRADDPETSGIVRALHDEGAGVALAAERALVEALGGGCQLPLGALARLNGGRIEMDAIVCSLDGGTAIRRHSRGSIGQPELLGRRLADELVTGGAAAILDQVRRATGSRNGGY